MIQSLRPRHVLFVIALLLALLLTVLVLVACGSPSKSPTATVTVPGPAVTEMVPRTTVTEQRVVPGPTVTKRVQSAPSAGSTFSDGTYVVGTDIHAGIYKTNGASEIGCYWARLASLSSNDITDNGIVTGPTTIQVKATDKALELSGGCSWSKIG